MVKPALELVVGSGPDLGARLHLDDEPRLVGRGRGCALQLSDRSVSRRHVRVEQRGNRVFVRVEPGASPLLLDGQHFAEVLLDAGRHFVIGETALAAREVEASEQTSHAREVTLVRSLMSDRSVGVRGLSAIFGLSEALDRAHDDKAVLAAVRCWAAEVVGASQVSWHQGDDVVAGELVEQASSDGRHRLVRVPLLGVARRALDLRLPGEEGDLKTMLRRLLVTAGRLVASAVARVTALENVETSSMAFRRLAWGSAREFLGDSEQAKAVQALVDKLAERDAAVLIGGETGVGKSFLARLIHEGGARARHPFRVVNCAAIPENLVESELFGHERGAFTGALDRRIGVLEAVGEGTVLLDEIGDLPVPSQAKLLHVLEAKCFEPVGSHRSVRLQARVLAASNRDLKTMAAAGQFRSDLFFRLSVVAIEVPPLRSRGLDILLLAERFLADLSQAAGRRVRGFHDETKELLLNHPWPGNVRELRNVVEHALVLGEDEWIRPGDLPLDLRISQDAPVPLGEDLVKLPLKLLTLEKLAIDAALRRTDGNQTKAAAILGINRVTLYKKLKAARSKSSDEGS